MKKSFILAALMFLVGLVACKDPKEPNEGGGEENKPEIIEGELVINKFRFLQMYNKGIIPQSFYLEVGENEIVYTLKDYVDPSALVASFQANGHVYVGDVKQESDVTVNDFSAPVVYRLEDGKGGTREYTVKINMPTGLPVVFFNTDSGRNVKDKENWESATIKIVGAPEGMNLSEMRVQTKGRGNSTWNFRKKQPYALKFDKKTSVMGMPKHKRWILMANYRDRTMMRNAVAFEISNRTGLVWAPRVQFVELVMNGIHKGNYMVCEQIRIDENRVNITEIKEGADTSGEAITGGYVLEVDQWDDEVNMFKSKCMENKWGNHSCTIMLKFPDEEDAAPAHVDYIKNYIWDIEELMMDGQFQKIYDEYIDLDSFVDFYIVNEITCNKELWRGPYSTYMHKDRGGKLFAGPVWDFDFTTFNMNEYGKKDDYTKRFYNKKAFWYKYFLQDPIFRARMVERWNELKEGLRTIPEYIDQMEDKLTPSGLINAKMYSPGQDPDLGGLFNHDEDLPYNEAVALMRLFYEEKFKWLDDQFNNNPNWGK